MHFQIYSLKFVHNAQMAPFPPAAYAALARLSFSGNKSSPAYGSHGKNWQEHRPAHKVDTCARVFRSPHVGGRQFQIQMGLSCLCPGFADLSFCRSLHVRSGVRCLRCVALHFRLVLFLRRWGRRIQRSLVCLQFPGSVGQLIKFAGGYKFSGAFRHPVNPIFLPPGDLQLLEIVIWGRVLWTAHGREWH